MVGTGGDSLAPVPPVSMVGADINGRKVINSVTYSGFAYMVWDRLGNVWNGTLFASTAVRSTIAGSSIARSPADHE